MGRPGDWNCPSCGNHNFSSRTDCKQCGLPRPDNQVREGQKPGDWICASCGDLVFASKSSCRMCGAAKPANGGNSAGVGRGGSMQSGGGAMDTATMMQMMQMMMGQ